MNTNQANVSFQSSRVSCSKAKTRLLSLAFLLCLSGSAWAQPLSFDLTMPDFLMLFKGSQVAAENHRDVAASNTRQTVYPPTPIGPPVTEPIFGARTPANGSRPFWGYPR